MLQIVIKVYFSARQRCSILREFYKLSICTKIEELAAFSPFYYMYMFGAILVGFGPWHVGQILTGHTGIIFPWATIVAGIRVFFIQKTTTIHLNINSSNRLLICLMDI